MPQVSRFLLRPQVWEKIFDMLLSAFLSAKDKTSLSDLMQEIFTPTEKIMFAKRFAACVLLAKGNDYRTVANTLRMSTSTISKMNLHLKYEKKGILKAVDHILKSNENEVLKEELIGFLDIPKKSNLKSADRFKRMWERERKIKALREGL